ncbi:MAG: RidA family protein [Alphaproteobacteria bacterium]|nr:RidA family protein [Alphaproteobacteria bacterium]
MGRIEARLRELGIALPPASTPFASFQHVVIAGGLAFVAGQPPTEGDRRPYIGRLGIDLTLEQGQAAAKLSALNVIAQMRAALDGDLDRVERCVKLGVFVNSGPDFKGQPLVANGASDLMVQVWGEAGRHARFAVGTIGPMDFACSVEAVFQVS